MVDGTNGNYIIQKTVGKRLGESIPSELYFSNGSGIPGTGERRAVAQASKAQVLLVEDFYGQMKPTDEFPFPVSGRNQFFVLTYAGAYWVDVDEEKLVNGEHEFSPLFFAANDVITQVRLNSPDN